MTTVLIVLGAIAIAGYMAAISAERYLRGTVLERVRAAIEQAAGAPVALEVPPGRLLEQGARRHLPSARLAFTDIPISDGRAHLRRLDVDLVGIDLTGPRRRHGVTAREGTFSAELSVDDLNTLITLPPGISRVELTPNRVRLRTVAGVSVDTRVELAGRGLRIQPHGGLLNFLPTTGLILALPVLPYGATIRKLEPVKDAVWFHGDLDPSQLIVERS